MYPAQRYAESELIGSVRLGLKTSLRENALTEIISALLNRLVDVSF